uniref:Transcription factor 23 n=1 Tax=Equus asinus TaxID=9793 RepID=A0A9L0JA77_EQUAS
MSERHGVFALLGPELTSVPIFLYFICGMPTTAWPAKRCHVRTRDPGQRTPGRQSGTCALNCCITGPAPGPEVLQTEASPENAARERSRVRTLRQAFLALQAALPAVPPNTKLSKLDVLVLATSYIAHLTRTLGHELPGPAWSPFLRGLRYLHPLKKWPMRSRLYAGGLGCSGLDSTTATTSGQRTKEAEVGAHVSGEAAALLPTRPLSPALGDK